MASTKHFHFWHDSLFSSIDWTLVEIFRAYVDVFNAFEVVTRELLWKIRSCAAYRFKWLDWWWSCAPKDSFRFDLGPKDVAIMQLDLYTIWIVFYLLICSILVWLGYSADWEHYQTVGSVISGTRITYILARWWILGDHWVVKERHLCVCFYMCAYDWLYVLFVFESIFECTCIREENIWK